jgi:hypothetical protein
MADNPKILQEGFKDLVNKAVGKAKEVAKKVFTPDTKTTKPVVGIDLNPEKHSQANFITRLQNIRERNILSRTKGKPLIFNENQLIDLMLQNKIPTCMQHCIIKVFPKMQGTEHEKFISAGNICAAVFQKYGYMKANSTVLTGRGLRNNTRHRLELDAGTKHAQYEALKNRLWRSFLDRRQRSLQQQKRIESMAAQPSTNISKPIMEPTIKPSMQATPSTNVIKAKGPVSSTRKMPTEE